MESYTPSQEIYLIIALESDREACLSAGMNDFISKPVTKIKLAEVLQKWLTATRETSC